ncbi:hypothetical protein KR222_009807, partial [Zaprionus bogoriensis]
NMSVRSLLTLTAGTAGAILLGYCIYFDWKRRSDPEYKRKVHERRQREQDELKYCLVDDDDDDSGMPAYDPNDYMALKRCFVNEIKLGEQLIAQGNMSDGLSHLANAILMCAQPVPMLQSLQDSLPEPVYMPLMRKLGEMRKMERNASSSASSSS